jgi:hypothetical protein
MVDRQRPQSSSSVRRRFPPGLGQRLQMGRVSVRRLIYYHCSFDHDGTRSIEKAHMPSLASNVPDLWTHIYRKYKLGVIIDLHAAPGSQNTWEHSSSRDGTQEWGKTDDNIAQTVQVIDFLASRSLNNSGTHLAIHVRAEDHFSLKLLK